MTALGIRRRFWSEYIREAIKERIEFEERREVAERLLKDLR